MALCRYYEHDDKTPMFRRGYVGFVFKHKAYIAGGMTYHEDNKDTQENHALPRMNQYYPLNDVHCLDLHTYQWMNEETSIPIPPIHHDGHTISQVNSTLYLIGGGTCTETYDPTPINILLSANKRHVYSLDMDPKCDHVGLLPNLKWHTRFFDGIQLFYAVNNHDDSESSDEDDQDENDQDDQDENVYYETDQEDHLEQDKTNQEDYIEDDQHYTEILMNQNNLHTMHQNSMDTCLKTSARIKTSFEPRIWHSATVVGNRIYIIGGRNTFLTYFNDVHYYDTTLHLFTKVVIDPQSDEFTARAAHGAVCPDGRHIYVFGGRCRYQANQYLNYNDLFVFDTETSRWSKLQPRPSTKITTTMTSAMSTCDHVVYSSQHGYPQPRCCFTMTWDKDFPCYIYILGGYIYHDQTLNYFNDCWMLDLIALRWHRIEFNTTSDPFRYTSIHAPPIFHNDVILFSGEGTMDQQQCDYASVPFLKTLGILQLPQSSINNILNYKNPLALQYYTLFDSKTHVDIILDISYHQFHLHKPIIEARMPWLDTYLDSFHVILSSPSSTLPSSPSSSLSSCNPSMPPRMHIDQWQDFLTMTLPHSYVKKYGVDIDAELVHTVLQYAYTDHIMNAHRLTLEQCVDLFVLSVCLNFLHLRSTVLILIGEHINPHHVTLDIKQQISKLEHSVRGAQLDESLITLLKWYNTTSDETTLCLDNPHMDDTPSPWYGLRPTMEFERIANTWKNHHSECLNLSQAMSRLYTTKNEEDCDFQVLLPQQASIPVHSSILAHSCPYFHGLLKKNFMENQNRCVVIEELAYPMQHSSLDALLHYMYSGSLIHIVDKTIALDIVCNIHYFYANEECDTVHEVANPFMKPILSLANMLMTHCVDILTCDVLSHQEIESLDSLASTLDLKMLQARITKLKVLL